MDDITHIRNRRRVENRINTQCLESIAVLSEDLKCEGALMTNKQRAAVRSAIHALQALEAQTR